MIYNNILLFIQKKYVSQNYLWLELIMEKGRYLMEKIPH